MASHPTNDLDLLSIENFRPYLHSYETLGEKDTVELHFLLQKMEKQRQEINRTIDVLSVTLDTLHQSHDELNTTIFSYRSLVSPIRNIPDNVLGKIFTYTLPTTRNAFPIATETPLLLTSVCKHWGKVAYSTPRLWSKLHIVLPCYITEEVTEASWQSITYVSTVKRFLGLSGSVPLSLSITYSHSSHNSPLLLPEAKDLLVHVIQQSHRWRDIDIMCGPETSQYIDERIIKTFTGAISLPLLRRLRVRPFSQSMTHTVDDFNLLYTYSMPSLRESSLDLSSSSYTFPFAELQAAPYWHSLTRLTIHDFRISDDIDVLLLGFLLQCQELQELLLGVSEYSSGQLINCAPVCLSKLTKLTLQGCRASNSSLYGYLETPLLTQLSLYHTSISLYPTFSNFHIDTGEGEAIPKRPLVQDFIAQCSNLQSLVISRVMDISPLEVLDIFEAAPGITTLILDSSGVLLKPVQFYPTPPSAYNRVLYNLMKALVLPANTHTQSTSRPLLSNLKSCSILHTQIYQADADMILAFCKSRMVRHTNSASLDHIQMVLMKETGVVDVRKELLEYAESIGRRVGEDIIIDITYPWGDVILDHEQGLPMLDLRSDLNPDTDCTWDEFHPQG